MALNRVTDSLHDYLNILQYMYIATNTKTIASCDIAYSDINCTVIASYRDQLVDMIRMEIAERLAMLDMDDNEDD